MDVEAKVKEIIIDKLGVEESQITPEASFTNDLGADSLDIVELVMGFESAFNVSIPDEDAEKIGTVGDATKYLKEKLESCTVSIDSDKKSLEINWKWKARQKPNFIAKELSDYVLNKLLERFEGILYNKYLEEILKYEILYLITDAEMTGLLTFNTNKNEYCWNNK